MHRTFAVVDLDQVREDINVPKLTGVLQHLTKRRATIIAHLLTNSNFTPEQRHVLELAFNNTLRKLNLVDRNDPICEFVARKVITIRESGTTNAIAIAEIATRQLDPGSSPLDT